VSGESATSQNRFRLFRERSEVDADCFLSTVRGPFVSILQVKARNGRLKSVGASAAILLVAL
jgi:hypothetical protein